MDGIGPSDLTIDALIDKMKTGEVKEVVFALNTTMEGTLPTSICTAKSRISERA